MIGGLARRCVPVTVGLLLNLGAIGATQAIPVAASASLQPSSCVLSTTPSATCPPGTPSIVAAGSQGGTQYGANSAGDVWAEGSGPQPGLAGMALAAPIVGVEPAALQPFSSSYWLVGADGGVFAFDVGFYGSLGGRHLNAPVVGMASSADGHGYWLVAADGGVFAFGDAPYDGSLGGQALRAPIVGMIASADGHGYWLVAADGGVFAFGDAPYDGSLGGVSLAAPVVGMALDGTGDGYWLFGRDGGVFAFGDAPFLGSWAGTLSTPAVSGVPRDFPYFPPATENVGYCVVTSAGESSCAD